MIALSGRQTTDNPIVWEELQDQLAALSSQGKRVIVDAPEGELIYEAPHAVIDAARQVIEEVRRRDARLR